MNPWPWETLCQGKKHHPNHMNCSQLYLLMSLISVPANLTLWMLISWIMQWSNTTLKGQIPRKPCLILLMSKCMKLLYKVVLIKLLFQQFLLLWGQWSLISHWRGRALRKITNQSLIDVLPKPRCQFKNLNQLVITISIFRVKEAILMEPSKDRGVVFSNIQLQMN